MSDEAAAPIDPAQIARDRAIATLQARRDSLKRSIAAKGAELVLVEEQLAAVTVTPKAS